MQSTTSPPPLCEICPRPGLQICSACHTSKYCSKTCQKRGYTHHKILCPSYQSFTDQTRPSSLHHRAIYFPVNQTSPIWLWLPFKREYEDEIEDLYDTPIRGDLLGENTGLQLIPIKEDKMLGRRLTDTISIMVRDAGRADGSMENQSVGSVLGTGHGEWYGPMIVYGEKGIQMDPNESRDLDLLDWKYVVDRLRQDQFMGNNGSSEDCGAFTTVHQDEATMSSVDDTWSEVLEARSDVRNRFAASKSSSTREPATENIIGIRIACDAEVHSGKSRYTRISIPSNSLVFSSAPLEVSTRIGLPLLTCIASDCAVHDLTNTTTNYDDDNGYNAAFTSLHIVCDPATTAYPGWGSQAPPGIGQFRGPLWSSDVGSGIVVRADKKPLELEHVEALCDWCQVRLLPIFHRAMGLLGDEYVVDKNDVLREVRREKFEQFWDAWIAGRAIGRNGFESMFMVGFEEMERRKEKVPYIDRVEARQAIHKTNDWSLYLLLALFTILWYIAILR